MMCIQWDKQMTSGTFWYSELSSSGVADIKLKSC